MPTGHAVFISYRVDDASSDAARIRDKLERNFPGEVFMDNAPGGIANGEDFDRRLGAELVACKVVIVVIGSQWSTIKDIGGTLRIQQPLDYVRLEVRSALEQDKLVIPVYVNGAARLMRDELPEDISRLTALNARLLSKNYEAFNDGTDHLVERIRQVLNPSRFRFFFLATSILLLILSFLILGSWIGAATEIGRQLNVSLAMPAAALIVQTLWGFWGDIFKRDDWNQRFRSAFGSPLACGIALFFLLGVILTVRSTSVLELSTPREINYQIVDASKIVSGHLGDADHALYFTWSRANRLAVRAESGRPFCLGSDRTNFWRTADYHYVAAKAGVDLVLYPGAELFRKCEYTDEPQVNLSIDIYPDNGQEPANIRGSILSETIPKYRCQCIRISEKGHDIPGEIATTIRQSLAAFQAVDLPQDRPVTSWKPGAFQPGACNSDGKIWVRVLAHSPVGQPIGDMLVSVRAREGDGASSVEMRW
jgi:hypothetical protein